MKRIKGVRKEVARIRCEDCGRVLDGRDVTRHENQTGHTYYAALALLARRSAEEETRVD